MANITLSGDLLDPAGFIAIGDKIRFTHKSNTGKVVKSSLSQITIPTSGSYLIDLQYGLVKVDYKDVLSNTYTNLGVVTVNQDTTATTLPELLNAVVPPTDAQLLEFQAILADCVTAENNAAQSATEAATSATDAANSASSVNIINDLSQAYIFETVADMTASTIVFPLNKTLTTKGNVTVNDGQGASYLVQAAQAVDGWKDVLLADGKSALWKEGIGVFTSLNEYESYTPDSKQFAGAYGLTNVGATILVGDSITAGTGSSTYKQSYAFQVMRSIWNSLDNGENTDRGYRYETNLNMAQEFARGDIGGAASIGANYVNGVGATNDALKIPVGTTLTITNREISSCDFFYDADATTATSVDFDLNGTVYLNKALAGTGIQSTFATNIIDGTQLINDSDTIGITAVGGDVYVTGLMTFRKSSLSPTVFVSAQPGWGYTDFLTKAPILSEHVQTLATGKVKLVILNLGTNNIFAGIPKTPDDYLIAVQDLITAYESGMGNCKFIISVPAKGGIAFPAVLASYDEYINKIVGFCDTNGHQVLRLDKTVLSKFPADYTIDSIHPNDEGHAIEAKAICDAIEVPYNRFDYRRVTNSAPRPINVDVTYNDAWGFFNSEPFTVKVQVEGNMVSLSGLAQPNGSVSTMVATTPVGFRPTRATFLTVTTSVGTTTLTWNTSGTLVIGAIASWVSFENINLVLNR